MEFLEKKVLSIRWMWCVQYTRHGPVVDMVVTHIMLRRFVSHNINLEVQTQLWRYRMNTKYEIMIVARKVGRQKAPNHMLTSSLPRDRLAVLMLGRRHRGRRWPGKFMFRRARRKTPIQSRSRHWKWWGGTI